MRLESVFQDSILNPDARKSVIDWRPEMCVGPSKGEFFDEFSAEKSLPGGIVLEFV